MPAKIVSVIAKGDLGKKINLTELVRKIHEAVFNSNFHGGRVEIPFKEKIDKIKKENKLEFEVCTDNDTNKVAKIMLYHSGKFMITCRDPEFIESIEKEFISEINKVL